MLALSDGQLAVVMTAARGLPVEKRSVFLQRVAARLQLLSRLTDRDFDDATTGSSTNKITVPTLDLVPAGRPPKKPSKVKGAGRMLRRSDRKNPRTGLQSDSPDDDRPGKPASLGRRGKAAGFATLAGGFAVL